MQYIQLSDDSYILNTSKGMDIITRKKLNFNRIKTLIDKGAEEPEILPLLETQPLPDGIIELYIHKENNTLLLRKFSEESPEKPMCSSLIESKNPVNINKHTIDRDLEFLGVYVSEEDIMVDWPEYIL